MNLITPLSCLLLIFTFKLGSTIPVNDADKLNPLVDDHEYPMVIRNDDNDDDGISGHSGRMVMIRTVRGTNFEDDNNKSLDDEVTTTRITTISDQDEIQLTSTLSPPSSMVVDFKLVQSQTVNIESNDDDTVIDVDTVDVKPNQYHPQQLPDPVNHNQQENQPTVNVTNQIPSSSTPPPPTTINLIPSTTINVPSTIKDLPEISISTSPSTPIPTLTPPPVTTQSTTTTTIQSFQDKVSSLIEDSFAQTTKLLIDLEEQIKLSQFNQQIETDYPPINIFTSTSSHSISSQSPPPSPSLLPLAYGFKLTAHKFLFRPLIRGSSIVSSAVNFNHNLNNDDDLQSFNDPDDTKLDPVNYETLDENANPDNPNSIINHQSHHWYGNQKQTGIQMQSMIDEVTRIEQNVEVLITELVSNRRYVTAAVFRSLLNYLRRLRISLERLQSRMAIIGVGSLPQGSGGLSSVGGSISSIASSVSSTFLPVVEQSSGPLGGSSGGGSSFNPIASGSAFASSAIESIRIRMNRVTEEIRTLINRMRLSFSSSPTVSSSSSSPSSPSSSSSDPTPTSPPSTSPPPSTTTRSPSTSRKPNYYYRQ